MTLKTILLVDDSEAEQFLYKVIIEKYNADISVLSAYDGLEALETLENEDITPDCILLDINMPRMNGFEFLDAYSKKYKNEHVVVAMLTSSAQEKDKQKAKSYECVNDFFLKPIDENDLQELEKLIKK